MMNTASKFASTTRRRTSTAKFLPLLCFFLIVVLRNFFEDKDLGVVVQATAQEEDLDGIANIPIIDLQPWFDNDFSSSSPSSREKKKNDIVQEVSKACRDVGFFMITGHNVDSLITSATWEASQHFFDLPVSTKLKFKTSNETEYPYGYEQSEQLSKGKQLDQVVDDDAEDDAAESSSTIDLKETYAIGPQNLDSGMPLRRWGISNLEETEEEFISTMFRPSLEYYFAQMERLALTLLEIFALALDLPSNYFESKMTHHMSALRLVHYYPSDGKEVRAGAHTDYGALTILNAKSPGLQVLLPATQDWYDVPMVPGALIINLGDLMQRWTNDEWVSTLHRVVMPTTAPSTSSQQQQLRRYSMAFFVNVNGDTLIEPIVGHSKEKSKYKPITAKDHLMAKHLASMNQNEDKGEQNDQQHHSDEL